MCKRKGDFRKQGSISRLNAQTCTLHLPNADFQFPSHKWQSVIRPTSRITNLLKIFYFILNAKKP